MATESAPNAALPKNYRLVYDIVQESGLGRHLTMSEVFSRAAGRRPGIGYSTVYRGLVRLRELGLIAEIVVPGADCATYEPVGPQHAHVRCVVCGSIEDAAYTLPPRILRSVATETGFAIESGTVTFSGRCARCNSGATATASR
jgi:Fe2+ or Zn2+ uptake regulation protein